MANNTIGWGQGATNNNIGWGRGSSNDIGWGSIYENSYVGDTDIQGADARFIITVKTDNAGTSASNQFTLPWIGTYDVEWGDGSSDVGVSGTQTHTYASAGTYDVKVTADPSSLSKQIYFNNGGDKSKLLDIKNWGSIAWTSMSRAFLGCNNVNVSAVDVPDLSSLTNMSSMFNSCTSLTLIDVSGWNTSSVKNIDYMFYSCRSLTLIDVSGWDTSSVTNMSSIFQLCILLKADLSGLDIASVTNLTNFATNTNINETGTTTNYDNTLISWAAQTPQNNIVINFGTAKYSNAAAAARELLTRAVVDGGYGWTITDGGGVDLLDTYTGAAAAYSLRTIKSSTTKVVRVRADVVGQPEQDFTAAQITDGTLATFVGAGNNGYVVTWYDQSGLGNHATQLTAANQPQIVASGVVITENGMPAVKFDGTDDYFTTSSISVKSSFIVAKNLNLINAANYIIGGTNQGVYWGGSFVGVNGIAVYESGAATLDSLIEDTSQHLASIFMDASTDEIFVDGVSKDTGTSAGVTISAIGRRPDIGATVSHRGSIQEIIIYNSDKLSDNGNINGNINDYYSIY